MLLEIKKVSKCRDGEYGYFTLLGKHRARIVISMKRNPTLAEYGATLLHEMLHAYTRMLELDGFKVGRRIEHKWIEECEGAIIELMKKHMGRK